MFLTMFKCLLVPASTHARMPKWLVGIHAIPAPIAGKNTFDGMTKYFMNRHKFTLKPNYEDGLPPVLSHITKHLWNKYCSTFCSNILARKSKLLAAIVLRRDEHNWLFIPLKRSFRTSFINSLHRTRSKSGVVEPNTVAAKKFSYAFCH